MFLCRHHAFQRTDCPLPGPSFLSIFSQAPALAFICLLQFEEISFLSTSLIGNEVALQLSRLFPSTCTKPHNLPIFFDHCSCSDSDKLFHATTVGPSTTPKNFRSPRPANWKKGGSDITASPLSLLAVLFLDYFLRGNKSNINQSCGNMHSSESPWPPLSGRSQNNPFKGQRSRPHMLSLGRWLHRLTVCVACFIKPILGNRYGPDVSSRASQGSRRSQDWFSRQKIKRFFWRDFSGEKLLPENSFLGQ